MTEFFKRKEDFESLSKVPILLVRFEEFLKRFDSFENYVKAEIKEIFDRIEKLDSLRDRIAETEAYIDSIKNRVCSLESQILKSIDDNNSFLKKLSLELFLIILGVAFTLIYTLLKK